MSNETTSHDDSDAENTFETLTMNLLSGLPGVHDNTQNAELKDQLGSLFPVQPEALLKHVGLIRMRFQTGDDNHLLMYGIGEQLTAMTLSCKERFNPVNKRIAGYSAPRDLEKMNALLKVTIT